VRRVPGASRPSRSHAVALNHAQVSAIEGPRYRCLDAECWCVDFCQECIDAGMHPRSHKMLRIEKPEDTNKMEIQVSPPPLSPRRRANPSDVQRKQNSADSVVLGFCVYSKRDAPAKIRGQLRHGRLLRWTKPKIDALDAPSDANAEIVLPDALTASEPVAVPATPGDAAAALPDDGAGPDSVPAVEVVLSDLAQAAAPDTVDSAAHGASGHATLLPASVAAPNSAAGPCTDNDPCTTLVPLATDAAVVEPTAPDVTGAALVAPDMLAAAAVATIAALATTAVVQDAVESAASEGLVSGDAAPDALNEPVDGALDGIAALPVSA
jgi:hypothetical protein